MPSKSFEVDVEPSVLVWARTSAGRTVEDVASRLSIKEELVKNWEKGKKKPTITQIRKLAKYYQRSQDVFLLSEPPIEPSLPTDFRNLPNRRKTTFHAETMFALRKARRLQRIAAELKIGDPIFYKLGLFNESENPECVAEKARDFLGLPLQTQFAWEDEAEALKQWIKLVEGVGVIVIQILMPIEDARAFSLTGNYPPIIVLNVIDSKNARIFSLFHEFCHILLNKEGICDPFSTQKSHTETFCNNFAGAFLVPKEGLLNHNRITMQNEKNEWAERTIQSLSKDFKVSKEAILRRLLIFDYTSNEFYNLKRKEWFTRDKQKLEEKQKKQEEREKLGDKEKQGWGRNIARECIQQNGVSIVSSILESYYDNRLTKYDIANYLDVNIKHLPTIEKTLWP